MKKLVLSLWVLILMLPPLHTSAREDKEITDRIQAFMDQAIEEYNIPGASLTVIHNGSSIFQDNWGEMSNGEKVTEDTTFLIGSVSKPLTSLAIMLLVEEGKINLDSPIDAYIPWFAYQSEVEKKITVRHLLLQTSGISFLDGFEVTDNFEENNDIKRAAKKLSGVTLGHPPGEVYGYNSANYLLLGSIIEAVAGQPFATFMEQKIFSPLGMNNTTADYESALQHGLVPGHQSWLGQPMKSKGMYDHAGAPYGYMTSTAGDLSRFIDFMLDGEELLSEEGFQMLKSQPEGDGSYGFGWHFPKEGSVYPYHTGATPDYRAEVFFLPEKNLGAVLLTNKYHELEAVSYLSMMDGIRAIMDGDEPRLIGLDNKIQWITLGVVVLIAIVLVGSIYRMIKKDKVNKKIWLCIGFLSILLGAGIIPLFTFMMGVTWRTLGLFVPDIQFFLTCMVALLTVYGFVIILTVTRKGRIARKRYAAA
ncbi:CubicO group peptidase (beta-lactamase class C family) [Bacillus tianshenii]|uniref:CubicO group peptidase (Beta-lactamase class C family) n=1 Tax=Sutcliffiella tianshenii TaxID=1463404 RepID=A0ABS2NZ81_9BACI|nr:serine hydrolase domain-containing protein [Bacillus tianshenii]MBM7619996.1 CubicO group peptidase (beta-lactamase class C family) [Bacillus tianshenii]